MAMPPSPYVTPRMFTEGIKALLGEIVLPAIREAFEMVPKPPPHCHVTEETGDDGWPRLSCGHRAPALLHHTTFILDHQHIDETGNVAVDPPVGLLFHCAECAKLAR